MNPVSRNPGSAPESYGHVETVISSTHTFFWAKYFIVHVLFMLMLYIPVNNFSVMLERFPVFFGLV